MEFFREIPITEEQAQAIARGLYTVAAVDGVHGREATLIADFYGAATGGEVPPVTSLAELGRRGTISPAELAEALPGDELRQLFVKAALLLAYVDGKVTAAERLKIIAFANSLGVSAERQAALEESVRDHLLEPLVRLQNTDAVNQVAKMLGR
jgi:tellurite resistance protein